MTLVCLNVGVDQHKFFSTSEREVLDLFGGMSQYCSV